MSILVGKHIREVLNGSSSLTEKVGDRIFLDGLNRDTSFPYIVYTYAVNPDEGNKDYEVDSCNVSVYIYAKDGELSLELADEVRQLLSHSTGSYERFTVQEATFESYNGSLNGDVYERELVFTIKTY